MVVHSAQWWCSQRGVAFNAVVVQEAFSEFDDNDDGVIPVERLRAALMTLGNQQLAGIH